MSLLEDLAFPRRSAEGHDLWTNGWTAIGGSSLDAIEVGSESRRSAAGETVTNERALGLSAYWACLRNLSQDVAKMPRQFRRRREVRGSDLERKDPRHRLIARRPNPLMSGFQFVQLMQYRALAAGNGYAEIVRNANGEPTALWPILPTRIKPVMRGKEDLVYEWRASPRDEPLDLQPRDVLHVRSLGSAIEGYSLVRIGTDVLGLGLAAQRNAARFFLEGMAKRLIALVKGVMSPEGRKGLRERIKGDREADPSGTRQIPILEGDVTLTESGINPEDAELLASREFTVEEIARIVRMALAKIQYFKRAQGWNSLDALNTDYVTDSLLPWVITWEEELALKLLTEEEQEADEHFFKIVVNGLMRGDTAARTKYYESGLRGAWLSPNDVRELEDMNPIEKPEADEYRMQAQMVPIDEDSPGPRPPPPALGPPPKSPPAGEPSDGQEEDGGDPAAAREALAPVFLDAATRLVRKETNALQRALKQHAANAAAFGSWAQDFYGRMADEALEAFHAPIEAASHLVDARPTNGDLLTGLTAWTGLDQPGRDWAARCRGIAGAKEADRSAALATLVLDLVLPLQEPAHA